MPVCFQLPIDISGYNLRLVLELLAKTKWFLKEADFFFIGSWSSCSSVGTASWRSHSLLMRVFLPLSLDQFFGSHKPSWWKYLTCVHTRSFSSCTLAFSCVLNTDITLSIVTLELCQTVFPNFGLPLRYYFQMIIQNAKTSWP